MNFNNIDDYSDYYVEQLILQYKSKPKARADIKAFASTAFMNFELMGIWRNIEQAEGYALVAIAQLFGINAAFSSIDYNEKYFATERYTQNGTLTEVQEGFQRYGSPKNGRFLLYSDYASRESLIEIPAIYLRGMIRMRSLMVYGKTVFGDIQNILDKYFYGVYLSESFSPPTIVYNIDNTSNNFNNLVKIFNILLTTNYLLKPDGVNVTINIGGTDGNA